MTEVRLVLGGGLVLDRRDQHHAAHINKGLGQAYFIVSLSVLVIVAEPTHDDDVCKVCRDE
jgi:hypothetical protein